MGVIVFYSSDLCDPGGEVERGNGSPNSNLQDPCKIDDVQLGDSLGEEAASSVHARSAIVTLQNQDLATDRVMPVCEAY